MIWTTHANVNDNFSVIFSLFYHPGFVGHVSGVFDEESILSAHILCYSQVADKRILELEATRDLSRIWLHVDMDAFYAAVETLDNPSLRGRPMAVGSMSMISTANYEV